MPVILVGVENETLGGIEEEECTFFGHCIVKATVSSCFVFLEVHLRKIQVDRIQNSGWLAFALHRNKAVR